MEKFQSVVKPLENKYIIILVNKVKTFVKKLSKITYFKVKRIFTKLFKNLILKDMCFTLFVFRKYSPFLLLELVHAIDPLLFYLQLICN